MSKFNSEGWGGGGYGCTSDIDDLYFPNEPGLIRSTDADAQAELQQAALTGGSASSVAAQGMPALQILAVGATVAVGGFFRFRAFRNNKREQGL